MNLIFRIAIYLLVISCLTGQIPAQATAQLNPAVGPFSLKAGSTFSASGGSPDKAANEGGSGAKAARIAADIREAEEILARNYIDSKPVRSPDLTKTALEGALRSLDPHSNFFDAAEWKDLMDEERSGYTGIGATIARFDKDGANDTYILSTYPGSPAARAQLRFGDKVVAINGEKMGGKDSDLVRDKIRGATGTVFRLTVERAATGKIETVEIRRNRVPQPSIPDAYILRPGIGYIDLSEGFNYTTADEFNAAIEKLKSNGMKSLVLDLRGNGGGIVDQAVKVAERFLPAGAEILSQR